MLRDELDLTGSKYGCGEGQCGACTVWVDGVARRSCVLLLGAVREKQVTTIEGLAKGEQLHPLQEAFLEEEAMQCAYCTSGMIMSGAALLKSNANPSDAEIVVFHAGECVPVRDTSANHCGNTTSRKDAAGFTGMKAETVVAIVPLEPERYELRAAPTYRFEASRREFFKLLGSGLLIISVLPNAKAAQESGTSKRPAPKICRPT